MTFTLKTFKELEKHFNDTVEALLSRESKTSISELSDPRKSEIQFIQSIFTILSNNLAKNKTPPNTILKFCSSVAYGAMFIVIEDIDANRAGYEKLKNSTLYKSLCEAMGIVETGLSDRQLSRCLRDTNKFLSQIYLNNDSRQGFKAEHALQSLSLTKLVALTSIGYALEKNANEKEISHLATAGESSVEIEKFKMPRSIPNELVAPFQSWDTLTATFNTLVNTARGKKNATNVNELSAYRQTQIEFLREIVSCLSAIKPEAMSQTNKLAILAGAMYLVRGDIAHHEYPHEPLYDKVIISKNPLNRSPIVLHTGLSGILNASKESFENIELLVHSTYQFLRYLAIEQSIGKDNVANAPTIRTTHHFSAIQGFNLQNYLNLAQEIICDCRVNALAKCEKTLIDAEELTNPKEKSTGSYNPFFWMRSNSSKNVEKEEDIEELLKDFATTKI